MSGAGEQPGSLFYSKSHDQLLLFELLYTRHPVIASLFATTFGAPCWPHNRTTLMISHFHVGLVFESESFAQLQTRWVGSVRNGWKPSTDFARTLAGGFPAAVHLLALAAENNPRQTTTIISSPLSPSAAASHR